MRILPFLLSLVATLSWAAPAEAHRSSTSRVHNIRHIAEAHFGPSKCVGGTMNIVIINQKDGIRNSDGQVSNTTTGRFFYRQITSMGTYLDCVIQIDGRVRYSTKVLCILISHEIGHAAGRGHSTDKTDVMFPFVISFWKPCERPGRKS